jgi:Mn-dependent DtxR family transcriptional regulator
MEDYLECIEAIIAEQGFVGVTDVAERLDIRRASVSIMIKRLAKFGFLNHVPYRGFTLTQKGQEIAARIKERHQTLEEFFKLLRLPSEALRRDVEGIEHHVSPDTLRLLHGFITFWKSHPALERQYTAYMKKDKGRKGKLLAA